MQPAEMISKIIVCDVTEGEKSLEAFCDANELIPFIVDDPDILPNVLDANIGLGGVILSEDFGGEDGWVAEAGIIRRKRPELPIFFRLVNISAESLPEIVMQFAGTFVIDDLEGLQGLIKEHVMVTWYPEPFVERIQEVTIAALQNQFNFTEVSCEMYYLGLDQLTHGKLVTVIPIESDWCRGYMVIQSEKEAINQAVIAGRTALKEGDCINNFSASNQVVGEITNLVWGALKNEFFNGKPLNPINSQIPIIINYDLEHLSFATATPQLCFDYTVEHLDGMLEPFSVYQKFVFNLDWSPELFDEDAAIANKVENTGELEEF